MKPVNKIFILAIFEFVLISCQAPTIENEFQNPPDTARPRVWWHWMNGNITQEGIRKDLEWMDQIGIRGVHNFDANLLTPVVVEKPLVFMTDEWKDAFRYTTEMLDSMGFEMTIAGSPGWSVTGGPWVEPADGMKKYVWTETIIEGGQSFNGQLEQPSDIAGDFQNVLLGTDSISGEYVGEVPSFYADSWVIAYRLPDEDVFMAELNPAVLTDKNTTVDFSMLIDGDLDAPFYLEPAQVGEEFWIQYEFSEAQTFKAVSVVGANHTRLEQFEGGVENRRLLVSDDGINFTEVTRIPGNISRQHTAAFASASGKYWRLAYETQGVSSSTVDPLFGGGAAEPEGVYLAEFVLHSTDRIDQYEDKAGFAPWKEDLPSYLAGGADAIAHSDIIDLTTSMRSDGTLSWNVPSGRWSVIRLGYGITGRQNHPASPAGTGLEVDKLDEEAVTRYINNYLDAYVDATGGLMGERGLQYIILDSYEAGHMNWTHDFPEEFEDRRGYSMTNWIPVLTGRIVESREHSEKFLWDFRKTIGEMIVENHYDVIGEELKKRGMGRYTESHERNRIYLADGMDVKRHADIPMAAMWTQGNLTGATDEDVQSEADIREAASVAHIYGKPFVAAESMTSVGRAFLEYPERLKRTADLELASGLNRFIIHTSVHQPLDDKMPGFSLGPFGQYFSRQETWAEQSKVWIDYLSRSSFMLQQGNFVADALVYYGENSNITRNFKEVIPAIPGYEYDFVNATALLEVITVSEGKMITPGDGSYSVLVLDDSAREMTLPVLEKIGEFVEAGIRVTGTRPQRTPSLVDNTAEFQALVERIWSSSNVTDDAPAEVLASAGVAPDVIMSGNTAEILYVHRSMSDRDIYWLDNRSDNPNNAEISFRVAGRVPVLWHPETGETHPISWKIENGRTIIPLDFESWEAYFIVFETPTTDSEFNQPVVAEVLLKELSGPWQVNFQENRGAPVSTEFESLISWSEHGIIGIKYFAGTAAYRKFFNLDQVNEGTRVILDLGAVKNIAEVKINGKDMGILWKSPFKADITDALQAGENSLEIRVTNVWVNRVIGDAQPDVDEKITFTTMSLVTPDQPLQESGLLGPVHLLSTSSF